MTRLTLGGLALGRTQQIHLAATATDFFRPHHRIAAGPPSAESRLSVHTGLLRSEGLPDAVDDESVWLGRYRSIVDLERHLHANGARIIKIFLHVSKEEQRQRLLPRIDEPDKNWKFSAADIAERKYWRGCANQGPIHRKNRSS